MQGRSLGRLISGIKIVLLGYVISMMPPALPAAHAESAQPPLFHEPAHPEKTIEEKPLGKKDQVAPDEDHKQDNGPKEGDEDDDQWGNDKDMGC